MMKLSLLLFNIKVKIFEKLDNADNVPITYSVGIFSYIVLFDNIISYGGSGSCSDSSSGSCSGLFSDSGSASFSASVSDSFNTYMERD